MIRVVLPYHLRNLARVPGEVELQFEFQTLPGAPVTLGAVLDAVESRHPVLRGTIREHVTLKRRPFIRYFACKEDVSFQPLDWALPAAITEGREPFLIIGAMAGG